MDGSKLNAYLFNVLGEDFASDDPTVRRKALYALGRLGKGEEVLARIRELASGDPDAGIRYAAKKALSYWDASLSAQEGQFEVRVPRTAEGGVDVPAFSELLDSADAGTQIAALMEAMRIGDAAVLDCLCQRVDGEEDPWVLSFLIKAVGALGGPAQLPLLSRHLRHENARVVANAVDALDMIGDEDAVALVLPLLNSEDNRVRANAVRLTHRFDPESAMRTLRAMAASKKDWMRDSAIYCLRMIDSEESDALLLAMLGDEPVEELAVKVCAALGERAGAEALPALLKSARGAGPRAEAAETAARALAAREGLDLEAERAALHRPSALASQALPALNAADFARGSGAVDESGIHRPVQLAGAAERSAPGARASAAPAPGAGARLRQALAEGFAFEKRDLAVIGGGVAAILLLAFLFLGGGRTPEAPPRPTRPTAPVPAILTRIASLRDPRVLFGSEIAGEGKVVTVQEGKGLVLRVGPHHVSLRLDPLPPELVVGDELSFEGTITGRSLFGVVFVDASTWKRLP